MIIYGWGYFNRRDHSVIRATCQSCGHHGHLPSYTSSKFFTLYFIPLIPLGTQKIVSECPHCKQARGMSLRKWNKLRRTELPAAVTAYEASPANEETAKHALGTVLSRHDRAALRRIGPQVRRGFERNAPMLRFLAGTYDYLCMDKEADEAYLAAMSVSDDAEIAAEANLHMEAQKLPKPTPPNRLLQSLPVLIVPAGLLFLFSMFVQRAATSRIDDAHVLSGLSRPYTAVINGQTVTLAPHQRIPGSMLVYGQNKITPTSESPFIEAGTFAIDVPWYRRPFGGPLIVVNPDQAAVMLWERTGYATGSVPDSAYQFKLASGRRLHTYEDIDFPFRDFPSTIKMPSGSGVAYRHRVSEFGEGDPQQVVQVLLGNKLVNEMQVYLRAQLRAADDSDVVFLGAQFLPRDEFIQLAEPRLGVRPVLVEWHRAYQTMVEGKSEGADLIARYRQLVEQEPENSTLVYLLSRLLDDPDENVAMLRRAAALPNPTSYAAFGLAYRQLIDGDFKAALASVNEALRLDPRNAQFQATRLSALYGLKQYDVVEREAGDLLKSPTADITTIFEHLYRLAKLGQTARAQSEIPKFVAKLAWSDDRKPLATAYLESAIAVATRNRAAYLAAAAKIGDSSWALQKAIVAGELDEALRVAKATPDEVDWSERLVLYVLLEKSGRHEDAVAQLEQATAVFAEGREEQQRWAAWLRGSEAPDPRLAAHACVSHETHCVVLCALAQKFPALADDYLARAAAMHLKDTFQSLALAGVLRL